MDSFNPRVTCPYCGFVNKPSITGWGGEGLNTRSHQCKQCGNEYTVAVYTEASTDCKISAIHLSALRSKIQYHKKRIREIELGLVNKAASWAKEFVRAEASAGGNQN